ncbi:protein SPT2 homolog isoform X1 [Canis lupus familiaris]|uniref:Protein SPT2 homolog n=3 Tax=Canis lupus familiaris TaxID=9615 RepID=A0A8C0PAF4_CANLF|nr:protein SPT2 homolog isoform X1 [Canis lupus familiaris]
MDFREILLIASKGQGVNNVPKRYSLAVGPPKKDPKVKGVQSAAVQAFLRRKEEELRQKALEEKRRKEELVKKRIELKHDKKARAMAKRTKDNFHGYNGIPVEEKSKKRQAVESHTSQGTEQEYEMEEEDEFLEYNQAESEQEYEEEQEPPKVESKPKVPLKSAPPLMNFTDLLRLAEKKQYEPVEIKVVKKTEERPMTAEELREREFLERKQRKKRPETDARLPPTKKAPSQKESVGTKLSKHPSSRGTPLPHAEKKSRPSTANEKHLGVSSSKSMPGERTKAGSVNCSQPLLREGHNRPVFNGAGKPHSSTYSPSVSKTCAKGTQKSVTEHKAKKSPPHPSHSRPGPMVTPHSKAKSPSVRHPGNSSSSAPGRPSTGTPRPTVSSGPVPRRQNGSSSSGPERSVSGTKKPASDLNLSRRTLGGTSGPGHPASSSNGPGRPTNGSGGSGRSVGSSSGPGRPISSPHDLRRPMSGSAPPGRPVSGPGRPVSGPGRSVSGPGRSISGSVPAGRTLSSSGPGRPVSSLGPGRPVSSSSLPLKPKCTVVSETISSKNIISRSSNGQMNGMKPSLSGYRSAQVPQRPPFPSSYKRQREYEDEEDEDEYDSEMEDFIEDEGEPQEEISKHIREIFGYDRKKYKDESDYALRYMESSWKEQQKEEAKSLRLGMQEDLEEMRREEEEMKRRKAKKLKKR